MSQPWYVSHAETIAQNVIGQLIAFVLLWLFDIPMTKALSMQLAFFLAAYSRGYLIRRAFNRWGHLLERH